MIKNYLKKHIPEKQWRKLSGLKPRAVRAYEQFLKAPQNVIALAIVIPIKMLPIGLQVRIKECFNPVRNMDYRGIPIRMAVNTCWQRLRLNSAAKEPETVKWIEDNVSAGDVFYDVGANVGAYSLVAFAATAGKAKIYAFEPGFSTYGELCKNISLNKANESIIPLQLGLGEKTGMRGFIYSELSAGAAQHAWKGANKRKNKPFSGTYCQSTPCCRLDELIQFLKLEMPDIVKIDVDGPEYEVLLGAKKTLSSPKVRSLLIELEDIDADKISGLLEAYGFVVDQVYSRSSSAGNYIFKKSG